MKRSLENPEKISVRQFRNVLEKLRPVLSDHALSMLETHFSARKYALTATEMAHALGYHSHSPANAHYGRLAAKLSEELGRSNFADGIFLMVTFTKPLIGGKRHWVWTMRPQLVQALQQLAWFDCKEAIVPIAESEPLPDRITTTIKRIIRDTETARTLKRTYNYRCQVCGLQIRASSGFYIEVHHLRPLGAGHNGVDASSNMLVLCPNHHAMFDLWIPLFLNDVCVAIGDEKIRLECRHKLSAGAISYYNDFRESVTNIVARVKNRR